MLSKFGHPWNIVLPKWKFEHPESLFPEYNLETSNAVKIGHCKAGTLNECSPCYIWSSMRLEGLFWSLLHLTISVSNCEDFNSKHTLGNNKKSVD